MTNKTLIPFSIILGSGIIAAALYFGLTHSATNKVVSLPTPTPVATPPATTIPTPTPSPTSTPQPEITWTKDDLLSALEQATMIDKDKISYSISDQIKKNDKVLIRGAVIEKGAMDGAGFMGYIDNAGVTITYVGQGVPDCKDVNPYGYPLSWADYCLDASGNAVKR